MSMPDERIEEALRDIQIELKAIRREPDELNPIGAIASLVRRIRKLEELIKESIRGT